MLHVRRSPTNTITDIAGIHDHHPTTAPIGFAHRGGRGDAPQNTLRAFREALAGGALGLESDVWLTADGVPVLDHDGVVWNRRHIRELRRAELPRHIPSLSELYEACGTSFHLSLDILDPAAAGPAVKVATEYDALSRLWLVGEWPTMRDWRSLNAELHVVSALPWYRLGPRMSRVLRGIKASGACSLNQHYLLWSKHHVAKVHDHGLLAFGWRANKPWQIARLRRLGCDGIYSDSVIALGTGLSRH